MHRMEGMSVKLTHTHHSLTPSRGKGFIGGLLPADDVTVAPMPYTLLTRAILLLKLISFYSRFVSPVFQVIPISVSVTHI